MLQRMMSVQQGYGTIYDRVGFLTEQKMKKKFNVITIHAYRTDQNTIHD